MFSRSKLFFFRCLIFDFFQGRLISFIKRKANSIIQQQKFEVHEKHDRVLISKVDFVFQISLSK